MKAILIIICVLVAKCSLQSQELHWKKTTTISDYHDGIWFKGDTLFARNENVLVYSVDKGTQWIPFPYDSVEYANTIYRYHNSAVGGDAMFRYKTVLNNIPKTTTPENLWCYNKLEVSYDTGKVWSDIKDIGPGDHSLFVRKNKLYVLTNSLNVWTSGDNGETWDIVYTIKNPERNRIFAKGENIYSINLINGKNILYRSQDLGKTFIPCVYNGDSISINDQSDFVATTKLLIPYKGQLLQSTDGGEFWYPLYRYSNDTLLSTGVNITVKDSTIIIVGDLMSGILTVNNLMKATQHISHDNGVTWKTFNNDVVHTIRNCIILPYGTVLGVTMNGYLVSDSTLNNWKTINTPNTLQYLNFNNMAKTKNDVFRCDNMLMKYNEATEGWDIASKYPFIHTVVEDSNSVACYQFQPNTGEEAVFVQNKQTNGIQYIDYINFNKPYSDRMCLHNNTLFTAKEKLYSVNINTIKEYNKLMDSCFDIRANDRLLFANHKLQSSDNGKTWKEFTTPISDAYAKFKVDNDYLYIASNKMYVSSDIGATWNEIQLPLHKQYFYSYDVYKQNILLITQNVDTFVVKSRLRFYYSSNLGRTWNEVTNNILTAEQSVKEAEVIAHAKGLFILCRYGIFRAALPLSTTDVPVLKEHTNISITPNPAINEFTIHSTELNIQNIMIYNTIGNEVLNTTVFTPDTMFSIPCSQLQSGVYVVLVKTVDKIYSQKLIITH
ncbi:MAG: T9SS type A sorting domain-containing protein [Candidatus Kapaibacterium sp.]